MLALNFDVISKRRADPVGLVDIKDFEIREYGQIDAREILMNEWISLYAFDFEKGQAMFVETTALSMLEYCGYSPEDEPFSEKPSLHPNRRF